MRLLVSLGPGRLSVREYLEQGRDPELPAGCRIDVELEAKEMLRRLLPAGASEVERAYRELRDARGERPTAGEMARLGYRPGTLRGAHGSWFEFADTEGDLDEGQRAVLGGAREWLREVETTAMTKSFEMVVLEVLLEAGALTRGLGLDELARRSHEYLLRVPELLGDIENVRELPEPRAPTAERWLAYWRQNPIAAWIGGRWFRLEDERLAPALPDVSDRTDALAGPSVAVRRSGGREGGSPPSHHGSRRRGGSPPPSWSDRSVIAPLRAPVGGRLVAAVDERAAR